MTPIVVMSGGGIKGATAAGRYAKDHDLVFMHINYGQTSAARELGALESLAATFPRAKALGIALPHLIQLRRSSAEKAAHPSSRGAKSENPKDLSTTVSPAVLRGLMPLVLSAGVQGALTVGSQALVVGLTRTGDATHLGLPGPESGADQRRELVHAYNIMLEIALRTRAPVRLEAPLMELSYAEVIQLANRFRVPLEKTWTCDGIGPRPCGQCDACKARSRAFDEATVIDPVAIAASPTHVRG